MANKKKIVSMEIFKGGEQTDSAGNTKEWTESDLDKIVEKTNSAKSDIPFTIGHQKKDGPAWAWGEKVFRKGKSIFTTMGSVTDELGIMLKKKMFKNRSIALRPDLSIRHIALLGAEPPAVKGLEAFSWSENGIEAFQFAESDEDFSTFDGLEFTENEFASFETKHAFGNIARLFSRLRDKMIEKDGVEKTDAILPDFLIDAIKGAENQSDHINEPILNESNPEDSEMDIKALENKVTELETNFGEATKKIETLEGEIKTEKEATEVAKKEFAEYKTNERQGELNTWVESMIDKGKILVADKESILSSLVAIDGNEAHDFSEGDKKVKKTPLDIMKASIEKGETLIEMGEQFTEGESRTKSEDDKLGVRAKEIHKTDGGSFSDALRKAISEQTLTQKIDK